MSETVTIPHSITLTSRKAPRPRHIALGKSKDFQVPACGTPIAPADLESAPGLNIPVDELCEACVRASADSLPTAVLDAIDARRRYRLGGSES